MSRGLAVSLVVFAVVTAPLIGSIGAQAASTNWEVDDGSLRVTFEPGDGGSLTRAVTVTNNDQNESVDLSASIDGGHSVESAPTLGPGERDSITVTLNADGDGEATLDISGGGKTERVDISIETPAYIEVSGLPDWMDSAGVLRGDTRTAEITVEEVGGYDGFTGIDTSGGGNVDLSNLERTSLPAGGETTVRVSFTAPSGADQHDDIGGSFALDPQGDGSSETSRVTLDTWVAYPAAFGNVRIVDDTFVFDEPRSRGLIRKRTEISVTNAGDRPLDMGSVSLSSRDFDEVRVESAPDSIDGGSSEDIEVTVEASTDLGEGLHDISGTFRSDDPSVDSVTLDTDLEVVHEVQLGISTNRLEIGDVPIGQTQPGSVTIGETLGYRSISGIELQQRGGPPSWISVTNQPPATLSPGSSASIQYEINFDPDADIGNTYRWTYVVEGEVGGAQRMTVRATPIPLNLDPIMDDLGSYSGQNTPNGEIATQTLGMVETLDRGIRDGSVEQRDISSVLTFSDGAIRFIEATDQAESELEAGNRDAAQDQIIQAAVAYDTMTTYAEAIRNEELSEAVDPVVSTADERLNVLIDRQRTFYQQRLRSENTTLLQKAAIRRELAQIATLQGDDQRAERLKNEADAAFGEYTEAVSRAEQARQRADDVWTEMRTNHFMMVLGQPFMLNPTAYETFQENSEIVLSAYNRAESAYRAAGETSAANTAATMRARRADQIAIARYSLFGAISVTLLLAAGLIAWTGRGMYWYVQDSQDAVSGDFLM